MAQGAHAVATQAGQQTGCGPGGPIAGE